MVEGTPSASRLTLAGACAGAFTERTRRKGRAHVEQGQVAIEGATPTTLLAFVRGERPKPYLVAVDFDEVETRDRVRVECSCPYFRDGYPCEHIFSVLLAVDGSGLNMVPPQALAGRLDVVPYQAGLPRDDDWFFEGENAFASRQKVAEAFFEAHGRGREPDWQGQLQALRRSFIDLGPSVDQLLAQEPIDRLEFRIHPEKSEDRGTLVVEVFERVPHPDHPVGQLKPLHLTPRELDRVGRPADRHALQLLFASPLSGGLIRPSDPTLGSQGPLTTNAFLVPQPYHPVVLPALADTQGFRCPLEPDGSRATPPIELDEGTPFRFETEFVPAESDLRRLDGVFVRTVDGGTQERVLVRDVHVAVREGLILVGHRLCRLQVDDDFDWVKILRRQGPLEFPAQRLREVLTELSLVPHLPTLTALSDGWQVDRRDPTVSLAFDPPDGKSRNVAATVRFHYGDLSFRLADSTSAAIHPDEQRFVPRNPEAERRLLTRMGSFGLRRSENSQTDQVVARSSDLNGVVRRLVQADFHVQAAGRTVRRMTGKSFRVRSGVDWFDLGGEMDFEGVQVALPEILRAVRDREGMVELEDGSQGLVPEEWMQRLEALVRVGSKKAGQLRFSKSQTLLLDILLEASDLEIDQDEPFRKARERLHERVQLQEAEEPEDFRGELRSYQREGLGWLRYVAELGLGGCLADDMGLGKTVQVLAHLVDQKSRGDLHGPTLVVTPRSLVYNWLRETERFAPTLSVLDYTGSQRGDLSQQLNGQDLVVTTYGTVRRDIIQLRELAFDTIVLDEAQAVKNPQAQSSKAVRLLQGRRRLALSGTPVENDAVELWSIFEFLNPKMLGNRRDFQAMARSDVGSLNMVARALKPLLLRRTKAQVLSELPEKTELTIHCQLSSNERKMYDELRDHYLHSIQTKIQQEGLQKARMHVLEALLRLRQACCHPALIDPTRSKDSSAKLDTLLNHVREVTAEGHKALVFSQFVKLLRLVRGRLDAEEVPYAYLDGHTTDREAQVRRFMEDDDCRLFLISLKAGGLGLNLTAADYVFILDPWWNPAVEAQAIDRAHRIGQTRPVFAYRFVAQETVEEKIIQLHAHKRKLADALVSAEDGFLRELTMDDLKLLLGGGDAVLGG